MRKTLVTAAIGGGAIAASGGSPEDVKNGFISAGAMVLVQDHYSKVTKNELDQVSMKSSKQVPAYCIGDTVKNCTPVPKSAILKKDGDRVIEVDRTKLDRRVPSVGKEGSNSPIAGDNSAPMKLVSKIPGGQGMSVMHDSWVTDTLPPLLNQPTIVPAIVIYYTGTGAPYFGHLQKTAEEHAIEQQEAADRGKPAGAPSAKLDPKQLLATKPPAIETKAGTDYTIAYTCASAKEERSWRVSANEAGETNACRLDYMTSTSKDGVEMYSHMKDRNVCKKKAVSQIRKALGHGMSCMQLASGPGPKKQ